MFGPGGIFELDLPTRGAVVGAQLRRAVAEQFGRREEEVELRQKRAWEKRSGKTVVLVGGGYWHDEQGAVVFVLDVEAREDHVIRDRETVQEAGDRRVLIYYKFV